MQDCYYYTPYRENPNFIQVIWAINILNEITNKYQIEQILGKCKYIFFKKCMKN